MASDSNQMTIGNGVNGDFNFHSYVGLRPRNLRVWDKAYGLNISTSCVTKSNNAAIP